MSASAPQPCTMGVTPQVDEEEAEDAPKPLPLLDTVKCLAAAWKSAAHQTRSAWGEKHVASLLLALNPGTTLLLPSDKTRSPVLWQPLTSHSAGFWVFRAVPQLLYIYFYGSHYS